MPPDHHDLILRDPVESIEVPDAACAEDGNGFGSARLDIGHLESLLLNLDASLGVHARTHFFTWTQGLLQSLIPHHVLICALRTDNAMSFRVDSFSTLVPDAAVLGGLLLRDASVAPGLLKVWKQHRFRPVIFEAADKSELLGGAFVRALERINATRIALHGTPDARGEAHSFFVFACAAGDNGPNERYVLQMVMPFLHAAWVRSQIDETVDGTATVVNAAVLTAREREILKWIYRGKSNGEVGAILKISPLTVKNHVQKILRKLNVVNRAQAVGKALDARMIGP